MENYARNRIKSMGKLAENLKGRRKRGRGQERKRRTRRRTNPTM